MEVELGCADAEFSFARAAARPEALMVGLDIREPCLARNRVRAADEGLANLLFGYVNLNVDIDRVFEPASVDRFHLLFPDPWVKKSHQKRRVIEPALVASLAAQLRPGGELHVASDVFDVALEIMATVEDPSWRAWGSSTWRARGASGAATRSPRRAAASRRRCAASSGCGGCAMSEATCRLRQVI
ncbi:hypothetical protein OV079_37450 [Nannocystis pusilla]|uniref:tRNA (guanine(46)-N(7))-methyltransferase n=1 Tax=Nannocystis pusilla TaxID=889268 RepID=A0A9X3F487_9BACT|nr:hypothetical protein [Nannocystis pusilla]